MTSSATSAYPDIRGYTIKSVLGKGGFATVYLAQQHTLQRDVALKVLNPFFAMDSDLCARFLREARDTASVSNHPNIVTIYDVGQVDNMYYIAMQYLSGPTLKHKIDSLEEYTNPNRLLHDLCNALSYVHNKGFVHRDIKPANILFTESGDAVLSDFGVARMDNRTTQLTHAGDIVGTAKYMSPEQCRGESSIDARSDLYSLGILLFEVLAKAPPFEASNPMALMFMHLNEPVPELPVKHSAYQALLKKFMAKQIDHRYESADEVLIELQSNTDFHVNPAPSKPVTTTDKALKHQPENETKTTTVLAVGAVVLLVLTSTLAFLYTQTAKQLPSANLRCPLLSEARQHERDKLVDIALLHLSVGRLAHPPGANALEAYTLALDIDPCNQEILNSVEQLRNAREQSL